VISPSTDLRQGYVTNQLLTVIDSVHHTEKLCTQPPISYNKQDLWGLKAFSMVSSQ